MRKINFVSILFSVQIMSCGKNLLGGSQPNLVFNPAPAPAISMNLTDYNRLSDEEKSKIESKIGEECLVDRFPNVHEYMVPGNTEDVAALLEPGNVIANPLRDSSGEIKKVSCVRTCVITRRPPLCEVVGTLCPYPDIKYYRNSGYGEMSSLNLLTDFYGASTDQIFIGDCFFRADTIERMLPVPLPSGSGGGG